MAVHRFQECKTSRPRVTPEGFTLIEAMVGIALLTIFLMGVVAMQAHFGAQTSERELRACLLENASSALAQRRNGSTATSFSFTCKKTTGSVSIGTEALSGANPGSCQKITATASAAGRSANVASSVCDF